MDITKEEHYTQLFGSMPVGTYIVRYKKNSRGDIIGETIEDCNQEFAEILGFQYSESLRGRDVRELYLNLSEHEQFMEALRKRPQKDEPLLGYELRVRRKDGKTISTEINARTIVDTQGQEVGRVCAVRDITAEVSLRALREDVGRTLHTYSATLMMLQQSLRPVLEALLLQDRPYRAAGGPGDPKDQIDKRARFLSREVSDFVTTLDRSVAIHSELKTETMQRLLEEFENLTEYREIVRIPEQQIPFLRDAARSVIKCCDQLTGASLSKERLRNARRSADDLLRLCCISALRDMLSLVAEMDQPVKSLRQYVLFRERKPNEKRVGQVAALIREAASGLASYAHYRRLNVVVSVIPESLHIRTSTEDLVRALQNLLHNAIKYSWRPVPPNFGQVKITATEQDGIVFIRVENYGVAVPKDEIDTDLIFEPGVRGRLSGDRRRQGTGVGLWDARQVARDHGGEVTIVSVPAVPGAPDDDLSKPFVTTVTMKLPACH